MCSATIPCSLFHRIITGHDVSVWVAEEMLLLGKQTDLASVWFYVIFLCYQLLELTRPVKCHLLEVLSTFEFDDCKLAFVCSISSRRLVLLDDKIVNDEKYLF